MGIILNILILIILSTIIIFQFKRRRVLKLVAKIPSVKVEVPLFGIIHKFIGAELKEYFPIIFDIVDVNESIQKLWFGTQLCIFANTPEQYKTIFTSQYCTNKPPLIYSGFFCKHSLIVLNDEDQERHRKILNNSMTPIMLKGLNPIFNEKAKQFVRKMEKKVEMEEFDVFIDVAEMTLGVLMKGNYHHEIDSSDSAIIHAFDRAKDLMMRRGSQPWFSIDFIYKLSPLARDAAKTFKPIYDKMSEILEKNKHLRVHNENKNLPLLEQLLNLRNGFSDVEIRDEFFILLFGGYETTAITLSTCLLLLAMHKDVQRKVMNEVDSLQLKDDFEISNDETRDLHYIDVVLKEVMRLFPVGPVLMRETSEEIELEGFKIPKGTILALMPYFMHRNVKYWGHDAHLFKPERFQPQNIAKVHPYAYVPFSSGKRICFGYKYAQYFMKIFMVNFFKSYEVDTSLKFEEIDVQMTPTLNITTGYKIKIKKRC